MIRITPAVLPHSWSELEEGLEKLVGITSSVQIDVVKDIFTGREALPRWEEFDFEFDIYLEPETFVPRAIELGATAVVVHARHSTASRALALLQQYRGGDYPVYVGLALRPTDTPEILKKFDGLYDYVQVMGIDNEGAQGEPFNTHAIELIRAVRAHSAHTMVQVDGAAAGHAQELVQAGAQCLVVGSAILHAKHPSDVYKELYTLVNMGSEPI